MRNVFETKNDGKIFFLIKRACDLAIRILYNSNLIVLLNYKKYFFFLITNFAWTVAADCVIDCV